MLGMRWGVAIALVGTLSVACGSTESIEQASPLRVATFNAGLAKGDIDFTDERAPVVVDEIAKLSKQLDLLCVQEFWNQEHWQALLDATKSELPNTVHMDPEPGATGSCSPAEVSDLTLCAQDKCAGKCGDDLITCGTNACGPELSKVAAPCLSCLLTNASTMCIDQVIDTCIASTSSTDFVIYDGAFDVGLLSRRSIASGSQKLTSYMVRANVLYAKVPRDDGDPVNVFCTHLASNASVTYDWKSLQKTQIDEVIAFIDEQAASGPTVVLADLNTGAGADDWPDNYALFEANGFTCPALEQLPAAEACTECPDNTFRADDSKPHLIDHILVRDMDASDVRRLFTQPVEIVTPEGDVTTNLSDHYGLGATLR